MDALDGDTRNLLVQTEEDLVKQVELLTLAHRYKRNSAPYYGVVTSFEQLKLKLLDFNVPPTGFTIHCGSGICVNNKGKAKIISLFLDGGYLDFIMGYEDIDNRIRILDDEVEPVIKFIQINFGITVTRRASLSDFWLEEKES